MSFSSFARSASSSNTTVANESWRSDGFLNFYAPGAVEGRKASLGSIGLKLTKPNEKILLEWLGAAPVERAEKLMGCLTITYVKAEASTAGFGLPGIGAKPKLAANGSSAIGYLNFNMPSKEEGKTTKIGAITLHGTDANQVQLNEWLAKAEANVAELAKSVTLIYRSATPTEGKGIALPA